MQNYEEGLSYIANLMSLGYIRPWQKKKKQNQEIWRKNNHTGVKWLAFGDIDIYSEIPSLAPLEWVWKPMGLPMLDLANPTLYSSAKFCAYWPILLPVNGVSLHTTLYPVVRKLSLSHKAVTKLDYTTMICTMLGMCQGSCHSCYPPENSNCSFKVVPFCFNYNSSEKLLGTWQVIEPLWHVLLGNGASAWIIIIRNWACSEII